METLSGLVTLRAFGRTQSRLNANHGLLDSSQRASYLLLNVQAWLALVLGIMIAVLAVFIVALATQVRTNNGYIGVSLVSLMSFNNILTNVIMRWTLLETAMGAVSRLRSFCETIKSEHSGDDETLSLREDWPCLGDIKVETCQLLMGK